MWCLGALSCSYNYRNPRKNALKSKGLLHITTVLRQEKKNPSVGSDYILKMP